MIDSGALQQICSPGGISYLWHQAWQLDEHSTFAAHVQVYSNCEGLSMLLLLEYSVERTLNRAGTPCRVHLEPHMLCRPAKAAQASCCLGKPCGRLESFLKWQCATFLGGSMRVKFYQRPAVENSFPCRQAMKTRAIDPASDLYHQHCRFTSNIYLLRHMLRRIVWL